MRSDELATKEGEFEKILSLAEELQEKSERYSSRINLLRIMEFSIIFSVIATVLFFLREDVYDTRYDLLSVLVPIVTILALFIYTIEYVIVRNYIKRRRRDSRALYEIVEMLRELGELQELSSSQQM